MKKITYRPWDDRFMGRKMLKGKTIEVYGKTLKETQAKLRLALKQVNVVVVKEQDKRSITVKDWWNKWHEEKIPYLKSGTIKEINKIFRKVEPIYDIPLNKLTKETLQVFFAKLKDNRDKEKTYLYLKSCINWAEKNSLISNNPFNTLKAPPANRNKKPAFKYEEQVQILEALKGKSLYPIILIYLCTGMRKKEFDFKNIENHIDFENYIIKAENLKGRGQNKRFKNILITKELCELIMANLTTIHLYNDERAYREFADFLKEIGIKGSIVTCRHTYATNNFYLGNPELFISKNMGHSTSQITKDNYTDIDYHLSKEKILKLYNNLYRQFWHKFWHKKLSSKCNFFVSKHNFKRENLSKKKSGSILDIF